MNRKLKIYHVGTTKIPSISPRNVSERKENSKMIKNRIYLIKKGQKSDFYSKITPPSLPTLKKLV